MNFRLRAMSYRFLTSAAFVLIVLAVSAIPVLGAGKGSNNGRGQGGGNGNVAVSSATCVVSGNIVHGTGLPGDEVINFMITDASGTRGWALGTNSEGWWDVPVPDRAGSTTYEFASRTWGPNGSKYEVFASCSA